MISMNEMFSAILSQYAGSAMVRRSKQNFVAVPTGEMTEEGKPIYIAVKIGTLLAKDTKTNTAFDFEAAQAEYAEWQTTQSAKASKPKATKGADPAKQAEKENRKTALLAWMKENPGDHTCTEMFEALSEVYNGKSVMTVGSDAKELFTAGLLMKSQENGKNFYSAV